MDRLIFTAALNFYGSSMMEDRNNLSQVSSDVSIAVCSAGLDLVQRLLLLP